MSDSKQRLVQVPRGLLDNSEPLYATITRVAKNNKRPSPEKKIISEVNEKVEHKACLVRNI